jgi:hypothetical protein
MSGRREMEAKVQDMVMMTDEMDFFSLIERRLEEEGFEVLETLPPDRTSSGRSNISGSKSFFTKRSSSRFAY